MADEEQYDFDVAISFAGEDRNLVREVADGLKAQGVRTFYDEDFAVEMWGEDLVEYFHAIYKKRARYMLMFISRHYAEKAWPGQERRAGLERALESDDVYILPVRLDDSDPPLGMRSTTGYMDARRIGVAGVVAAAVEKVAEDLPKQTKTPRLRDEIEHVLRDRPEGWEYLLWAGTLNVEMQGLQDKYLDHEVGYAPPTGDAIAAHEAEQRLDEGLNELQRIVGQVGPVFAEQAQTAAFGRRGEPGNPERIDHLAKRMAATYEDLLDWSRRLRGVTVPVDYRNAYVLLSKLVDQPVKEYREFVDTVVREIDRLPAYLADPEGEGPFEVTLRLTLTMDDAALQAYLAERQRLAALY